MTTLGGWISLAVLGLAATSVFFSFVAAVGFYRLPDVYARAHAASKSETLGALCGLAAAALVFVTNGTTGAALKLALLALFVLVTGPTAAHAVARAAADAGIEPWTHATARERANGIVADGGFDAATRDGAAVREAVVDDPSNREADR